MKTIKTIMAAAVIFAASGFIACTNTGDDGKAVTLVSEEQYRTSVEDFTDREWEYLGERPAVVDFYAGWFGPFRRLAPHLVAL